MKKVTKHTRAPRDSAKFCVCPHCGKSTWFYHFSWCATKCVSCKAMVEKTDWLIADPDDVKTWIIRDTRSGKRVCACIAISAFDALLYARHTFPRRNYHKFQAVCPSQATQQP